MNKFQSLSNQTSKWSNETFDAGKNRPERTVSMAHHLIEEATELKDVLAAYFEKPNLDHASGVHEELADCIIIIADICAHMGITMENLADAGLNKLSVNKKRRPAKENGVVNHIKD